MKTAFVLATAAAALLLPSCIQAVSNQTAAPSPAPSLLPAEEVYEPGLRLQFRYEALPKAYTQELRQVFRDCAAVEFETRQPGVNTPFALRIERGGELETLLADLQEVPRWYTRRSLCAQISHEYSPCIRFCDAEGGALHRIDIWPEGGVFAREGLEHVSLWELFRRHYTHNRLP